MRYSEELISEIIAANDIVDIASGYMKLTRSGSGYKGLCPFHGEKTPSFHISPDKQLYHCFGCGAGGSVLQFIMNIENLDFKDAIKLLAARAKIALPEDDFSFENDEAYKKRQDVYKLNAAAARFFYKNLMSEKGTAAQKYLLSRALDKKTVTLFGLGYAPDSYTACVEAMKSMGFEEQLLLDANLARRSEKTGKLYDFFRNRVMFPIIDVRGNVIAFGGRVIDASLPKYLHSPNNVVFNKSRFLFALNFAKNKCHEQMIVCEGYMDVIAMHKAGFTNAVAALGTAMTAEHATMISRYTKEVVLCYDSDEAGQKATARAMELLKNVNVRTRVLKIPGAKDPDEFIKKNGAAAFSQLLEASENAVLYKIGKLKQQYNTDILEEKIELTNKLAEIFASIENEIEKDVLIKETAVQLGVSAEAIYARTKAIKASTRKNEKAGEMREVKKHIAAAAKTVSADNECRLANLIASDSKVLEYFKNKITPEFFKQKSCEILTRQAFKYYEDGIKTDAAALIAVLEPQQAGEIAAAASEQQYENPVKAAEDIYNKILNERLVQGAEINDAEQLQRLIDIKKQKG